MNNPFSHLFQPLNVGSIEIKKRVSVATKLVSATWPMVFKSPASNIPRPVGNEPTASDPRRRRHDVCWWRVEDRRG